MKRVYTLFKYKRYQQRRMRKCERLRLLHYKKRLKLLYYYSKQIKPSLGKPNNIYYPEIKAPRDFRFLDNTAECALFFRDIRTRGKISVKNYEKFKTISLTDVELIDFASVHTLTAICKELKCNGINVYGNLPKNDQCREFMVHSGFLDNKYDRAGRLFRLSNQTETMSFEMGQGLKLQTQHIINLLEISLRISDHLYSNECGYSRRFMPILKEICGNSIDWADSYKKQWFFAARFDANKVTVAVIDLGQGILASLERKFIDYLKDLITAKSYVQILSGAFNKKYGSKSNEINRNRGLPSLKAAFEHGIIKRLIVLTNNVLLSFDERHNNCKFANTYDAFKGTLYFFEIDKSCLIA